MGGAGPNDRQRRFADLVLAGRPASRAYLDAGYQAASMAAAEASASRLLRNAKVAAYLAERRAGAARQTETDLARVQLLVLGSVQKLAGVLSLGSVALASGTVGGWLGRWPRLAVWQERCTGLVMIGLGLRLLVAGNAGSPPLRGQ